MRMSMSERIGLGGVVVGSERGDEIQFLLTRAHAGHVVPTSYTSNYCMST